MFPSRLCCLVGLGLLLAGCDKAPEPAAPVRPVRTIVIKHTPGGEPITLTGQVQAQNTVNLAFRVGGRLQTRSVDVGNPVTEGQLVARLEQQDAQNALLSAQASLTAAQGVLSQAQTAFKRTSDLLSKGYATRAEYDQAQQALTSAQAQVDSAQAQVKSAQDNLGYTELHSDAAGTVTAKGAEPGEVVQAGQMILQVAREGGRDAVFNAPAPLIRQVPKDVVVDVTLSDDPGIAAQGRVREVSPQADPTTGTYAVKVGLINPPATMRLGATVTGRIVLNNEPVIQVPATALTEESGKPAVWVVDPSTRKVALRQVAVLRYDPSAVIVSDGLKDGEIVVTAGVQALQPGQEVRLLDEVAGTK